MALDGKLAGTLSSSGALAGTLSSSGAAAANIRALEARLTNLEGGRITSLTEIPLAVGTVVEAVGIPVYIDDVTEYEDYGLTETGWYGLARITGTTTEDTAIEGAAGYIVGDGYVDVAVRFEVASMSQTIVINWGDTTETYVFKATDLAVRNLDYRTTYYVYDLAPFVTWTYTLATDTTFVSGKRYFTESDGVYTEAEVTVGASIPANTYYVHSKATFSGMTRNITYRLDELIDCPIEVVLPEVANDGYGCWFEFQLRYDAQYSCTLLPPTSDVKAGTTTTHPQKAGINVIDLHYTEVNGAKIWALICTHSDIPT